MTIKKCSYMIWYELYDSWVLFKYKYKYKYKQ